MWGSIIGFPISPEQVVLCMVALKLAREAGQHEPDNITDAQGYLDLLPEVMAWHTTPTQGPVSTIKLSPETTAVDQAYRQYAIDRFGVPT